MKVLCPIDFSNASVNAAKWFANCLKELPESQLDLCHFIHIRGRASMFVSINDILKENAESDLLRLKEEIKEESGMTQVDYQIYISHPKTGIVSVANKKEYDLIVMGTTGLNALKDVTVGSVTEYLFEHSSIPIISIPENTVYQKVEKIALAADGKLLDRLASLHFLTNLSKSLDAEIQLLHVYTNEEEAIKYDPAIDWALGDLIKKVDSRLLKDSLSDTIQNYCKEENIDILTMVHRKRNWFRRLFSVSATKDRLFEMNAPLLILNEN